MICEFPLNRLRENRRGTLTETEDGVAIADPIMLPGAEEMTRWELDNLGNWRRKTAAPVGGTQTTEIRQHNKLHQVTKVDSQALAYDAAGNLTDDGDRLLAYDALNRLIQATRKSDERRVVPVLRVHPPSSPVISETAGQPDEASERPALRLFPKRSEYAVVNFRTFVSI